MQGDPVWMRGLLAVHVAAGAGSFLLAPVALATAKGGAAHKRWGMVYLWSMGVVAATALPMALYRPVLFLAMVSVLAFYLTFSGYRVLKLKDLARGGRAKPVDWLAACLAFGACATMVVLGLLTLLYCMGRRWCRSCWVWWECGRQPAICGCFIASQRRRCSGGTRI